MEAWSRSAASRPVSTLYASNDSLLIVAPSMSSSSHSAEPAPGIEGDLHTEGRALAVEPNVPQGRPQ